MPPPTSRVVLTQLWKLPHRQPRAGGATKTLQMDLYFKTAVIWVQRLEPCAFPAGTYSAISSVQARNVLLFDIFNLLFNGNAFYILSYLCLV